jgi:uncharacterized protein YbcI
MAITTMDPLPGENGHAPVARNEAVTAPGPCSHFPGELLTNAVVGWFKERTGRGPQQCRAHVHDEHVLVLLRSVQTPLERSLVSAGHAELVNDLRRTLRNIHVDELCALISLKVGRPVETMLSDHDPTTDTSALVFLLRPDA